MNNLLRKIFVLLSLCAINGFAQQHVTVPQINSLQLKSVDRLLGGDILNVCYTVSFNSSLKIGDKAYCYITPVDINGKNFPNGNGSFLTAGGLYNITQRESMSLTITVPAAIIKQIPGKDEYRLKVNVMPEKDDDFFLEKVFVFSYSDLKRAVDINNVVKASINKKIANLQNMSEKPSYKKRENKCNYLNIGYQRLEMKPEGGQNLTSNLGVFASVGKTFILNSQPSVFNYGLDVVWADLNYVNYKLEYHYDGMTEKETYHQMEIGMQGGMALILKPSQNFSARIYARYAPCFAAMYVDKDFYGSYGDFIVVGLSFNLGSSFGIGADYRYGSCKYKKMGGNDAEGLDVPVESLPSTDFSGFRAYLVYQF